MRKVLYQVLMLHPNGQWLEFPRTADYEACGSLVAAILRVADGVGDVVKVIRWVDITQEQ